ncbi:MAG: hypothetical protein R3C69_07580 [Geminicoccaceae bacterium]
MAIAFVRSPFSTARTCRVGRSPLEMAGSSIAGADAVLALIRRAEAGTL